MTDQSAAKKYQVEDRELLLKFYKRALWDRMVPLIPRRIAPNLITIMGQIAAVLGVALAAVGTMGYPFLYVVSAFCWLAYLTADNIDGPHARRTGQTSVLGEFLDHGLDGLANGCLLITAALVLQMEGIWMGLFLAVGAVGFIVTFWEQYRTERLVLPELSSAEGITVVAVIEILAFLFREPTWLRFDFSGMNLSVAIMILVLIGYAIAIVSPLWRARKAGARPLEIIQPVLVTAALCGLIALGSPPLAPSITIGLFGADVVCRMIRLRHRGEQRGVLAPYHWFFVVPPLLAAAFPSAWTPEGWAVVAVVFGILAYTRTVLVSGFELVAVSESAEGAAS